jgi:hypothetical protein
VTAPTRRVDHGRNHRYFLDGDPVLGVTTILNDGVPKQALIDWAARETAGYAVDHWDELAEMKISERMRALERARWEGRDSAAVRGTDVHALAHRLAAGERLEVPEALIGLVDAYLRFADEWIAADVLAEVTIGNRLCRYMGTLDLIADLRDGHRWIIDFKTGSGVYPEAALQLAAYRNAEFYLHPDTGAELELPQVDKAGVVWLRDDGYDLYEADAGDDTFDYFLHAQRVAQFARQAKERARYIGEALVPPRRLEAAS